MASPLPEWISSQLLRTNPAQPLRSADDSQLSAAAQTSAPSQLLRASMSSARMLRIRTEVELSTAAICTNDSVPVQTHPHISLVAAHTTASASSPELDQRLSHSDRVSHGDETAQQTNNSNKINKTDLKMLFLRPRPPATALAAADVKLLVCLGDSLLTGLCVTARPGSLKNMMLAALAASTAGRTPLVQWIVSGEHRHNTCVSGDGDGVVSVGRLLRIFSPDIVGLNQHKTTLFSKGAAFNFARTGSTIDGLSEQVNRFVLKLRRPEFRALDNEWKLIYIWIGANDVFCSSIESISSSFESNLVRAIQSLRALISRAYICLLTLPDLGQAHVCNTEKRKQLVMHKSRLVNDIIRTVATKYVWNDSSDFRVVLQPIPADELTEEQYHQFISQLDRVHPNFLAQQLFAKCIWNNLWLPDEQKLTHFTDIVEAPWIKPGANDFLA